MNYRAASCRDVIVFECEAHDILEADAMYAAATRDDPKKESHIGCSVENIKEKE